MLSDFHDATFPLQEKENPLADWISYIEFLCRSAEEKELFKVSLLLY